VLAPAFRRRGALQRLHRLDIATTYPNLSEAAVAVSTSMSTLGRQLRTLEIDLKTQLFVRAARGHPMTFTASGQQVIAAKRAYAARGDLVGGGGHALCVESPKRTSST
jgi:hypothetical protein